MLVNPSEKSRPTENHEGGLTHAKCNGAFSWEAHTFSDPLAEDKSAVEIELY